MTRADHPSCSDAVAKLTDRNGSRYVSPLGDRRPHAVLCSYCLQGPSLAIDGLCDPCAIAQWERATLRLCPDAVDSLIRGM